MDEDDEKNEAEDGDKLNVLFECNGKFFMVMLLRQTAPEQDEGPAAADQAFLARLDECDSWDGGPDDEPEGREEMRNELYGEIVDVVQGLLQPCFEERAPPAIHGGKDLSLPKDLDTYLNPEVWNFQLVTRSRQPALVSRDDMPPLCFHPPIDGLADISAGGRRVPSSAVRVLELLGRSWVLKVKVSLNGSDGDDGGEEVMCCKVTNTAIHESLGRELVALQKIGESLKIVGGREGMSTGENESETGMQVRVRVPAFKGVVESAKGKVVGILMEYIPVVATLADLIKPNNGSEATPTDTARREKWAAQIEHTLGYLHGADVVWGDAKSSNIPIDDKDDVWVVDFGGGQTWGWVKTELVGTEEGDLQALRKIKEALGL